MVAQEQAGEPPAFGLDSFGAGDGIDDDRVDGDEDGETSPHPFLV
jgi:hypothetical protein